MAAGAGSGAAEWMYGQPVWRLAGLPCLCAGVVVGWAGWTSPCRCCGCWAAAWVLGAAWLLRAGVPAGRAFLPQCGCGGIGCWRLWLAWLAVVQARMMGINFLLSVLVLVWVADIFAYFAGRALACGSPQQAGALHQPGKSWEGVWGGMAGVVVLALVWVGRPTGRPLYPAFTPAGAAQGWWLLVAVVFMVAMSVAGDLVESLIKRSAGVKDSSAPAARPWRCAGPGGRLVANACRWP
jgi:phosphatidate cytidylyltransferase